MKNKKMMNDKNKTYKTFQEAMMAGKARMMKEEMKKKKIKKKMPMMTDEEKEGTE